MAESDDPRQRFAQHREQWRLPDAARVPPGSGAASLAFLLSDMHEDLRAYLFLFVDLSCIGSTAASCAMLHSSTWSDSSFWRTYAGPCLFGEAAASSAAQRRERFRRWLFHLEGRWDEDFAAEIAEAKRSDFGPDFLRLLGDARYIVSGLMPAEDEEEEGSLERFCEAVAGLLNEYNPLQLDERSMAEALVSQIEWREDVFSAAQMGNVALAFDQSVERAILERGMEDRLESDDLDWPLTNACSGHDHFMGPLEDDSEDEDASGWQPQAASWQPQAPSLPLPLLDDGGEAELSFWHAGDNRA